MRRTDRGGALDQALLLRHLPGAAPSRGGAISELRDLRLDRLEGAVSEIKQTLARLEPLIIAIHAQLPHLATKAELADKPGKVFLATAIGILIAAYAVGLAGLAALPVVAKLVQ